MHCALELKKTLGVVLAGGKSSRMGKNKALLSYQGAQLIDHMSALLKETGLNDVVISGDYENHECIPDIIPDCGPVGGIHSIIKSVGDRFDQILFVPVDMPLLNSKVLRLLLQDPLESEVVVFRKRPLPFVLNIHSNADLILNKLSTIPGSGCSVRYLLKSLDAKYLELSESNIPNFANVNTPQEWESIN